jgi:hypothetical protein
LYCAVAGGLNKPLYKFPEEVCKFLGVSIPVSRDSDFGEGFLAKFGILLKKDLLIPGDPT